MTLQVDEFGRLACADLFPPHKIFEAERQPDGSIRLSESAPTRAKIVRPIRTADGFLMLPGEVDSKTIAAAIRSERDAQ